MFFTLLLGSANIASQALGGSDGQKVMDITGRRPSLFLSHFPATEKNA